MDRRQFLRSAVAVTGAMVGSVPLLTANAIDNNRFIGHFRSVSPVPPQVVTTAQNLSQLGAVVSSQLKSGKYLTSLATIGFRKSDPVVAVFTSIPNAPKQLLSIALNWDQFAQVASANFNNGYRLAVLHITGGASGKFVQYTAAWRNDIKVDAERVTMAKAWDGFTADSQILFNEGYRMNGMTSTNVSIVKNDNDRYQGYYTGIWHSNQGNGASWWIPPSSLNDFATQHSNYFKDGLRIGGMTVHTENGSAPIYTALVRNVAPNSGEYVTNPINYQQLKAQTNTFAAQGYQLVKASAYSEFTFFD